MGMLKLFNLGLMVVSFGTATVLQLHWQGGGVPVIALLSLRVKLINFVIFWLILIAWHWIFSLSGQYRSQRVAGRWSMITGSVKATMLASVFLVLAGKLCDIVLITPTFIYLFW